MTHPRFFINSRGTEAGATNIALGSTPFPFWSDLDNNLDVVIPDCQVGDLLCVGLAGMTTRNNTAFAVDVVTVVAGARVNSISSGVAAGTQSGFPKSFQWSGATSSGGHYRDEMWYRVQAGDLDGTNVRLRKIVGCVNNNAKTLYRQWNCTIDLWATNYGQVPSE